MPTTIYSPLKRSNKVLLIYTGGTIGMGQNPVTGALEPLDLNHLVSCIPEFSMIKTGITSSRRPSTRATCRPACGRNW